MTSHTPPTEDDPVEVVEDDLTEVWLQLRYGASDESEDA